jgi:hypothetical protein
VVQDLHHQVVVNQPITVHVVCPLFLLDSLFKHNSCDTNAIMCSAAGYYGPNGQNQCSICHAGYYCSGGTSLEECPAGKDTCMILPTDYC